MEKALRCFTRGSIWHICNKSIANFGIFDTFSLGDRFLQTMGYYNNSKKKERFARASKSPAFHVPDLLTQNQDQIAKFLCYCVMPDHYHLLLAIQKDGCLSKYLNTVQDSFTRFFNLKFHRKGPLWQSRFRCVQIESDEQLLHVMRYIHLNPVTKALVDKPEEWKLSSYPQYLESDTLQKMKEVSIQNVDKLKAFTENQIDYQRKLLGIKRALLE